MSSDKITLDHGAGGLAAQKLVSDIFLKHFGGQDSRSLEDCAMLEIDKGRIAFSTDTFTVTPLFFPGGDIGELAVNGTVNDLSMRGASPLYLSAGFVIEENLDMELLDRIVCSMARAAVRAGVQVVTGDTKVVPRGAADKLFINTSGIGLLTGSLDISASRARPGDKVILSGTMADHGVTILCQREGLKIESELKSDTASLCGLVKKALETGGEAIHVLRDPTRGGVAGTLNEIAQSSQQGIMLEESSLPVKPQVLGACDILGLDPLYVANEGKLLAIVAPEKAGDVLAEIRNHELGRQAAIIGEITISRPGKVFMNTSVGGSRIVDMPTGEQLPRIC